MSECEELVSEVNYFEKAVSSKAIELIYVSLDDISRRIRNRSVR